MVEIRDPSFVHLHVHTEYSLVDGLVRIEALIKTVSAQQSTMVAVTDQSNLFAMVKLYEAAEAKGIKPIIGADVWIKNDQNPTKPYRLILLCQNAEGYQNLTQLVSRAYVEGQLEGKPQIEKEWLKTFQGGLIAIASALQSDIAEALLSSNDSLAEHWLDEWQALFPKRFYLELTRTHQENEERYIQEAVKLSEKKGCALVATNNVRFLHREDFEAHEARVCIHEGYTVHHTDRPRVYTEEQYLKSTEEMVELFSDIPEALQNSVEIAKRCTLDLKLGEVHLPNYPLPAGVSIESYLEKAAEQGLKNIFAPQALPMAYQERLHTELKVLNSMGYAGYFLIVADFIQWAKNNQIPVGPGRGSGAGSLVAYALGITGIDPLLYDLLFERFLNPERVSMPDFDIDFCMEGRDRVIDYVAQTYGREAVSQIITYGTLAAKAVIRDVGRVLGHPYGFVDKIAKLIPLELGITLEKALLQEEGLRQRYQEEEEVRNLIDLAKKLEGITRNAGKHAGGVVIAPSKLTDFTPLYCDVNEGTLLTQFDKNDVEAIGLVKFDFLGLRTLTIIDWAMKAVNDQRLKAGLETINIGSIPLEDELTFNLLKSCHTTAIFQLESRGMKDLIRRLQPDVFEEIIALVALFRPGPLQSGMVDDFINRKHGRSKPEYLHPLLTQILKPTYGIILYQEQVMQIAQVLAGYTLGGADLLRRAMGKKKPEEMAKQRSIFIEGAVANGVETEKASYIFDLMEKFAGYGFNKSHSAAYAFLTYQTAWLKAHYKEAFMAAVLSSDMAHTDKVVLFIEECRQLNIQVLPPDVNQSEYKFTVNAKQDILYGLGAIKGVGENAIHSILEARKERVFSDIFDFCARVDPRKVSRRVLEALIRSGAFDGFKEERATLMASLEEAIGVAEQMNKSRLAGQSDLFGHSLSVLDNLLKPKQTVCKPWPEAYRLQGEKETLGHYLTGHPLDRFEKDLSAIRSTSIADLRPQKGKQVLGGLIVAIRTLFTKKGDKMAFITLEDKTGRQEVAVFSDQMREHAELLVKEAVIVVEGEVSVDTFSNGYKIRGTAFCALEEARLKAAKVLKIGVSSESLTHIFIQNLKNLIALYQKEEGCPIQLMIQQETSKVQMSLGQHFKVNLKQALLESLSDLPEIKSWEIGY